MFDTSDERQRRYWDADPIYRHASHPVVEMFVRQRLDYVAGWLDFASVGSALDVGCGDGFSSVGMSERIPRVWGVDRSNAMLARHPHRGSGRLARGDITRLPFRDGAIDLVYCWEVLHHVGQPGPAVAEMARVSRRWVLIAEPNPRNPLQLGFALVDREHRWVLKYSLDYMRQLLRNAGLHVVHASSGGFILPNRTPSWLAAWLRRFPYPSGIGISNWVLGVKPPPTEG